MNSDTTTGERGKTLPFRRLAEVSQRLPALQKALVNAERLQASLTKAERKGILGKDEQELVIAAGNMVARIRQKTSNYGDTLAQIDKLLQQVESDEELVGEGKLVPPVTSQEEEAVLSSEEEVVPVIRRRGRPRKTVR